MGRWRWHQHAYAVCGNPHLGHFDQVGLTWATEGASAGSRLTAGGMVDVWQALVGTDSTLCQVSWSAPDGSLALASACIRSVWNPHLGHFDPSGPTWAMEGA
jgi:hypothetical protein